MCVLQIAQTMLELGSLSQGAWLYWLCLLALLALFALLARSESLDRSSCWICVCQALVPAYQLRVLLWDVWQMYPRLKLTDVFKLAEPCRGHRLHCAHMCKDGHQSAEAGTSLKGTCAMQADAVPVASQVLKMWQLKRSVCH